MDRAGARIHRARASQDPLVRDLESVSGLLSSVKRRRVARVLSETEHLPSEERIVLLRRVLGSSAGARIVPSRSNETCPTQDSEFGSSFGPNGLPERIASGLAYSAFGGVVSSGSSRARYSGQLEEPGLPAVRRTERRQVGRALSASPVQVGQETSGVFSTKVRRRQTEAVLGRLDAVLARETAPEAVVSSIVQRTPGRFESVSPVDQAAHIAPLGRESLDPDRVDGLEEASGRRPVRATCKIRQPVAASVDQRLSTRTPASRKARPTRWAVARLDAPAVSADFASKAPLLSECRCYCSGS